jgi:hypothetical protein
MSIVFYPGIQKEKIDPYKENKIQDMLPIPCHPEFMNPMSQYLPSGWICRVYWKQHHLLDNINQIQQAQDFICSQYKKYKNIRYFTCQKCQWNNIPEHEMFSIVESEHGKKNLYNQQINKNQNKTSYKKQQQICNYCHYDPMYAKVNINAQGFYYITWSFFCLSSSSSS